MYRPFVATYTNITDEQDQSSTPTQIGQQSVVVARDHHRKIFDSLVTSVSSMNSNANQAQQLYNNSTMPLNHYTNPQYSLQAQKYCSPNSNEVTYMFGPKPNPCCSCFNNPASNIMPVNLTDRINLSEIKLKRALEALDGINYSPPPYQLHFHQDAHCSTTDLLDADHQIPISNETTAVAENRTKTVECQTDFAENQESETQNNNTSNNKDQENDNTV